MVVNPFAKFWKEQSKWSQETFGSDKERGPEGPLKHLAKEVKEAQDNPTDLMEYVDMMFLVIDSARRAGFGYSEFVNALFQKLQINKNRVWIKGAPGEPSEHDRSK